MEAPRPIKRRRSREEPAERRRKDKIRKRLKRGRKTAAAPVVDGSSTDSEDNGNNEETAAINHPEAYLFEGDAGNGPCRGLGGAAAGRGTVAQQGMCTETVDGPSTPLSTDQEQGRAGNATQHHGERDAHGNPEETLNNYAHYSSEDEAGNDPGTRDDTGQQNQREPQGGPEGQGNAGESARNNEGANEAERPNAAENAQEGGNNGQEMPRNPQGNFHEPANPSERLAMALAGVRGSSEVSDSAINKMLKVALEHRGALDALGRAGNKEKLYTKKLRPRALRHIPRVFTAILLEEKVQGGLQYRRLEDLAGIPKEYVNLPNRGRIKVIREESYVRLRDIKEHHRKIHLAKGTTEEELRNHYGNAAISVDGVEEGNKCKTTFHVVTLRLGSCIYLYKVFNPLVGHKVANPSVQEVLG